MFNTSGLKDISDQKVAKQVLETDLKKHELTARLGLLGKFLGADTHSSLNIAGLIITLLIIIAGTLSVFSLHRKDDMGPVLEIWKVFLAPIMTVLGFVFGKSNRSD